MVRPADQVVPPVDPVVHPVDQVVHPVAPVVPVARPVARATIVAAPRVTTVAIASKTSQRFRRWS